MYSRDCKNIPKSEQELEREKGLKVAREQASEMYHLLMEYGYI